MGGRYGTVDSHRNHGDWVEPSVLCISNENQCADARMREIRISSYSTAKIAVHFQFTPQ
jgi:hypothetical protein